MKKTHWTIADLIDLEFFLNQDEGEELDILAARDRQIYTELPSESRDAEPPALLRAWLSSRRHALLKEAEETALPGRTWQEILYIFYAVALCTGLFSGGGLAFSFLAYSGRNPVNVAGYFAVFVLVQVLLFFLLAGSAFFRRMQGKNIIEASLLYRLISRLFSGLLHKVTAGVQKRASRKISAETRLKWSASAASISQIRQRYGLLFLRPFFLVVQTFGVSFNIGVLAATLFKVIGADVAFGWQSTLQITPASVHELVQWIALPWSWLPDTFIPTLSQIEGSRLVLKEGIYLLVNTDLTSWWPFLCLSVLCYGLLPRLLLLIIVGMQQHRDLAKLDFRQGYFRQPLHRMRTPRVSTAARRENKSAESAAPLSAPPDTPVAEKPPERQDMVQEQGESDSGDESAAPTQPDTDTPSLPLAPLSPLIVLIPDEILPDCPVKELEQQIHDCLGYALARHLPFWTIESTEDEELAQVKKALDEQESRDVLILLEAWQPPIEELFTWLGQLRRSIGPEPIILLALIGKPSPETILTPVQAQHLHIWQLKTAALGDPGLQLIELVKS